ncbi:MAG: IS110 family transposase, partial [Pirellula sp.]
TIVPTPNPMDSSNMIILALDLGKFNTMCCIFNSETRKHEFINAVTERNYLTTLLKKTKCNLVVMEACGPSGWINDLAISLGHKTLVCSTNEDAWKWSNVKRKTHKDDAFKLARMAAMGELKAVHMPSKEHREFRSLVKYRKTIDNRITKMKCTIRAWFVNHGITIDSGEKAWNTGRVHINSFRKSLDQCSPDELWKAELDIELTQLDASAVHLQVVTKKLEEIGKKDPRIQRVMTIPGVGPRTAEILVACIDDAKRFASGREVSAYFGLVPRQYQSGETDRNGRITKRGNPLARTILVECAWASLRYNPWAKAIYERISGKQKTRRKKAAIALARKIAVIAWALLRDEKDWEPKRMVEITESFGKMPLGLKETLLTMKPKECRHKRKNRLEKEARAAARALKESTPTSEKPSKLKATKTQTTKAPSKATAKATKSKTNIAPETTSPAPKPRRARKLVVAG